MMEELEIKIQNGYKIILYNLPNKHILQKLYNELNKDQMKAVIWVLGEGIECEKVKFLTQDEWNIIMEYYFLYEFTDQLIVLTESVNYPNLMNYVLQGILTEDELVRAIIK